MAMEHDARTPRTGLATASAAVEGAADGLADGIERHGLERSAPRLADEAATIAQRNSRSHRLRARLERADEKVDDFLERTKGKARAVAESARRARAAPPHIVADAKAAGRAWAKGIAGGLALHAAAGLAFAVAFVLFTVGLVQGLNRVWGVPWGAFAVTGLYAIAALGLLGAARGRAERGREEARVHLRHAGDEARRIVEPVRTTFRADGRRDPTDRLLDRRHEVTLPRGATGDPRQDAFTTSPSDDPSRM